MTVKPPLLKWAGGKRWLVPHLQRIWAEHKHRRLVEPLCGALAVTFGLRPQVALLNDINPHCINFFKWLKKGFKIDFPMLNDSELYYSHRVRFNELIVGKRMKTREAAGLFYYLNRTGYNGLCRFNKKGAFNVPFGKYKIINYIRDFNPYKRLLSKWLLSNIDFEDLKLHKEDFIYADPPYDAEFTQYSKEGFFWEDQIRLVKWLSKHPGPVVLSNQATDRIIKLYREFGFTLRYLDGPRRISCTGDRSPAKEVLALKGL
ncbi:DNA adenine methylase [Candidatus Riflebacteria bacterium]